MRLVVADTISSLEGAVVPAGLPESLGDLVTLKEFRVVGSRVTIGEGQNQRHEQYPKGPIPKSLSSLKLTTLDLEVTSLSELGNLNFDTLTTLTTLILMNNAALGRSVPFLAKNRDMKSLYVDVYASTADPSTISGQELSEME